jgi:hypothetical protein
MKVHSAFCETQCRKTAQVFRGRISDPLRPPHSHRHDRRLTNGPSKIVTDRAAKSNSTVDILWESMWVWVWMWMPLSERRFEYPHINLPTDNPLANTPQLQLSSQDEIQFFRLYVIKKYSGKLSKIRWCPGGGVTSTPMFQNFVFFCSKVYAQFWKVLRIFF